jgi:hypothetical protein
MLPVLPPLEKTRIELKRGVQRLELYVKMNDDKKAIAVLDVLKNALELIEKN